MDYISVKETSKKFHLSERRIQKLCETNRIEGCKMVSGIWLIPATAIKPSDERMTNSPKDSDYLSLKELCDILSISTATGRNWIKLGKLIPEYTDKRKPYFTKQYTEKLKAELQSGKNQSLKSRRNKKFVCGNSLYSAYISENCQNIEPLQQILRIVTDESIALSSDVIQYFIADCALHLLAQKYDLSFKHEKALLSRFLKKEITLSLYDELIYALIADSEHALLFCEKYSPLFDFDYVYEPAEDILGLIYISCKNIDSRKATGSYYTPTKIVKKLIEKLDIASDARILDPCCGTGNFLLQLPAHVRFDQIYGNDTDTISVKITRLNMVLKYDILSVKTLYEHITKADYLASDSKTSYQYIIGNPPWGYEFSESEKEKLRKNYRTASGKNIESYDLFIEKALRNLSINGQLSFILPEAILNVKAHTPVRTAIMESNSIRYLNFLGNAFDKVQCPCIILQLIHTGKPLSTVGMEVSDCSHCTTILTNRKISAEYFSFHTTDAEYQLLEKIRHIPKTKFLAGNADFALGIVTGNNKKYISSVKNKDNEVILKGSDICKYHTNPNSNYIVFNPQNFQQVAPIEMYRAPEKLLYRFISSQLVFAYDDKQTLSLNSCNLVIPKLEGLHIKYILAILNSRVAQFIYKMEFHSVKVLRSHIENIPIPDVNAGMQNSIIQAVEPLINGLPPEGAQIAYEQLDQLIFKLFNLTSKEQDIIKHAVDGENKFLF